MEVVKGWIEEMLLLELKLGQTVILDNASFHQLPEFKTLTESAGCTLTYLPTYSLDLMVGQTESLDATTAYKSDTQTNISFSIPENV
jgi:hypothetical protein